MTCALYFGSFNPLHKGHIAIAEYVLDNCAVDSLRLVLTPVNPFKDGDKSLADAGKRLEQLQESVGRFNAERARKAEGKEGKEVKRLEISTVEFGLPRPNYTYSTLCHLRDSEPENKFVVVIGADNLAKIERWYKWKEILEEFPVMVYPRKGVETKSLCSRYGTIYLDAPMMDISSTQIREGIKAGMDMSEYLY